MVFLFCNSVLFCSIISLSPLSLFVSAGLLGFAPAPSLVCTVVASLCLLPVLFSPVLAGRRALSLTGPLRLIGCSHRLSPPRQLLSARLLLQLICLCRCRCTTLRFSLLSSFPVALSRSFPSVSSAPCRRLSPFWSFCSRFCFCCPILSVFCSLALAFSRLYLSSCSSTSLPPAFLPFSFAWVMLGFWDSSLFYSRSSHSPDVGASSVRGFTLRPVARPGSPRIN